MTIQGFSNYDISENAIVTRRFTSKNDKGRRYQAGHVVVPGWMPTGYAVVKLISDKGTVTTMRRGRLMLTLFVGAPPTPTHQANHINGSKGDDRIENLEWVTPRMNCRHAYDTLGVKKPRGERHHHSVLTDDIVRQCRHMRSGGMAHSAIARHFGVARPTITAALSGRNWGHVSK